MSWFKPLCLMAIGSLAACSRPSFPCEQNSQCNAKEDGFCEPHESRCAFPDSACDSGSRYGPVSGARSKQCVDSSPEFVAIAWRVAEPPTIDGDISDLVLGEGTRATSDFGVEGTVWFRWDDQGLYIAADVVDPNLKSESQPGVSMFWRDGLEMLFDTHADRADGRIPFPDDFKLVITAANEVGWSWGGIEPTEAWDAPTTSFVRTQGTLNQAADSDEGYTIEAHVPWNDDFRAPQAGQAWGFNFKVNDANVGRPRDATWKTDGRFNFPSQSGTLLFGKPGAAIPEPVEEEPVTVPERRYAAITPLGPFVSDSPTTFRTDQPIDKLFDGCILRAEDCRAAEQASGEIQLTLDLGRPRQLGFARLYADQSGSQVSRQWMIEVETGEEFERINGTAIDEDDWSLLDLRGTTAQIVRLRVFGVDGQGTEAAEFELYALD